MKKFLAFIIVAISCFATQHAFAANPGITATTSSTATSFTVNYTYTGTPTQTVKIYSWLTNTQTGVWVDRQYLLMTITPTMPMPQNFSATYNFTTLGLTNGTKYGYYLADGTTDSANLLYGVANFIVGTAPTPTFTFTATGQYAGQTTGQYQETFDITPTTPFMASKDVTLNIYNSTNQGVPEQIPVTIPVGDKTTSPSVDDLVPGSYTASIYDGTTKLSQTVAFTITAISTNNDGKCNPTYNQNVASYVTATTPMLCSSGAVDGFSGNATIGPWTWKCDPVVTGGTTDTCTATLGAPKTDGLCNPAYDGMAFSSPLTAETPNLCIFGTTIDFAATDKANDAWTWGCAPSVAGGKPDNTCAAVLSSTSTQTPSTTNPASNFLANPLSSSLNTFPKILAAVMNNIVLPIMIPFISIMLIYCGFLFVIARKNGSTDGYSKAKKTLMYTLIGAALVLGATVVSNALQGTLNDLLGPTGSSSTTTTTTP